MNKIKVYHAPKYYVIEGPPASKGDRAVVLADDAYDAITELSAALSETLGRVRDFQVWFEDDYLRFVEMDDPEDPLLSEVARLGLNGRAETTLEKYGIDG